MAKGKTLREAVEQLKKNEADLSQPFSLYYKDGYVILRHYPQEVRRYSPLHKLTNELNKGLANYWPNSYRSRWDGKAYEFTKILLSRKAHYKEIISDKPKPQKEFSGYNLFRKCNHYAYSCRWELPRLKPPREVILNIRPQIVEYYIDRDYTVFIRVVCEKLPSHYKEKAIRVWANLIYYTVTKGRMVGYIQLDEDKNSYIFGFKSIHLGEIVWGQEKVDFRDLDKGKLEISADVVAAEDEDTGAIASPSSNIVELKLPEKPHTEVSLAIYNHVRNYYKELYKRYYERNKATVLEKGKRYRKTHRDKLNLYQRQYYQRHLEKMRSYKRTYFRNYYKEHKEKICEIIRRYHERKKKRVEKL